MAHNDSGDLSLSDQALKLQKLSWLFVPTTDIYKALPDEYANNFPYI